MEEKIIVRFDGSIPLKTNQKPCESMDSFKEKRNKIEDDCGTYKAQGDGSIGIKGEITIYTKQSAVMFVNGIIEQFDITREELDV